MTTPLTLTRPAKIHCLARPFGVSGCFRNNQSNSGRMSVSVTDPIWHERKVPLRQGTCEQELWTAAVGGVIECVAGDDDTGASNKTPASLKNVPICPEPFHRVA